MNPASPKCMTSAEVQAWWDADRLMRKGARVAEKPLRVSPCDDCSQRFAEPMRLVGRCDGTYPGENGRFPVGELVRLPNGHYGYASEEARREARRASWRRFRRATA